jgi:hypothetical protein
VPAERHVVDRVLDAHRTDLLEQAPSVRVRFSSGGLAFRSKGQPAALLDAEAVLVPSRQEIIVCGHQPEPWSVAIPDSDELKRRLDALHTGSRLFRWTPEDVGVFAGAALWTYVMLPLLLRDAAHARVRRCDRNGGEVVLHLDETIAGHGPRHVVHFDVAGRILRHDYTATAFGRWALAAQSIEGYRPGDALPFGMVRRVTPRVGRWRLPGPTLVWIQVREIALDAGLPNGPALPGERQVRLAGWSRSMASRRSRS